MTAWGPFWSVAGAESFAQAFGGRVEHLPPESITPYSAHACRGHLCYAGEGRDEYEYFLLDSNVPGREECVYRAPRSNPLDISTWYRHGARFFDRSAPRALDELRSLYGELGFAPLARWCSEDCAIAARWGFKHVIPDTCPSEPAVTTQDA